MQKGDVLELTIESVGMDGEGVARCDGMVIFVPFTLVGEIVRCQITFVKKSFAKAKVIKLLKSSDFRVQHLCPLFRKCGGCDMQHIEYQKQLAIKRENVANCFKKYAGIDAEINNVIPSKDTYYYRNKAQFPLFSQNGKVCLGFFKENTHEFVEVEKCYLLGDWCDKFCDAFLRVANELKLSCYDEKSHSGLLRHLVLRKLNDAVSVTVVVNSNKFDYTQKFVKELSKIGIKFSFYVSYNTKKTNLIMSNAHVLFGDKDIETEILGIKTFVNPMSFMQINDYIRDKIYTKVKDIVSESHNKIVVDSYSGVGVLTNILASCADKVYGIEIVPQAVENANQLAKINGNDKKIVNICGDSAVELPKLAQQIKQQLVCSHKNKTQKNDEQNSCGAELENANQLAKTNRNDNKIVNISDNSEVRLQSINLMNSKNKITTQTNACTISENNKNNKKFDASKNGNFDDFIVVLDPPRKGCDMPVLQGLLQAQPSKIVYISCNPATLARDLAALKESYKITLVQPYDMFPNTSHVETLVCLERK